MNEVSSGEAETMRMDGVAGLEEGCVVKKLLGTVVLWRIGAGDMDGATSNEVIAEADDGNEKVAGIVESAITDDDASPP